MGENEELPPQTGGDGEGASTGGKKGRYRRDKPWVGSGVTRGASNFFLLFPSRAVGPDAAAQFLLLSRRGEVGGVSMVSESFSSSLTSPCR